MKQVFKIRMAKILLVSLLLTQSDILQTPGAAMLSIPVKGQILEERDVDKASVELNDIEEKDNSSQQELNLIKIATPSNAQPPKGDTFEEDKLTQEGLGGNRPETGDMEIATPLNARKLMSNAEVWDGVSEQEVFPVNDIYNIQYPSELAWVMSVTNDGTENFDGKIISIINDLDMGGYEWGGIGTLNNPFKGSFNGNGHIISGIKQENQTSSMGLFGAIEVQNNISIRDLNIDNAEFSGNAGFAGILSGYIKLKGGTKLIISNIETSGTLDVSGCSFGGGLVGNIYSPDNSTVNIEKVKTSGNMTIVYSAVNNTVSNTGGIIGCYDNQRGNIKIIKSNSDMNVYGTAQNSAKIYVGGIFGSGNGDLIEFTRVYATGKLTGEAYDTCTGGGLIGYCETNSLKLSNSYTASDIEMNGINGWAGGLVGFLKCKTTYADSLFEKCHVTGHLSARQYAAFIVQNDSDKESVNVESCYYNKDSIALKNSEDKITHLGFFSTIRLSCPYGYGITDFEMGEESSFDTWNFDNVWVMQGEGYPELQENGSLYDGLIAGMDSEEIVYSNLMKEYVTKEIDLNYSYSIDEAAVSEEWNSETILAQIKITLPDGFSFSQDEVITEMYMEDEETSLDYVYVYPDRIKNGKVKVFIDPKAELKNEFRFRISISSLDFETYSSYNDMTVVFKEERPEYVPQEAVYNKFNGHWYYYYNDVCSWEEALDKCAEKSGYLVTITSEDENSYIKKFIENEVLDGIEFTDAWIGLYNLNGWNWITEESVRYNNWDNNEINNLEEAGLYGVLLRNYQWDFMKNGQLTYFCEWEVEPYIIPTIERPIYVPDDAIYNEENGHWYKYFSDICTWQEAKKKCENMSGYLVTITSENEKMFLEENLYKNFIINDNSSWIGLYYNDKWEWVTNERTKYRNWQEIDEQFSENMKYVTILKNQFWKIAGEESNTFICEWGDNLDVKQQFPDTYELPVLEENDARDFLGFVFNKSEISKMDLKEDELFQLLTGKIEDPELQFYTAETFLEIVHSQISKHIGKASHAQKYLLSSLESFLRKQLDGMKDIPEKEYNSFYNSQISIIQEFVNDSLFSLAGKYLNISITEDIVKNMDLAFSTYKKVSNLPNKIQDFVEKSVAVIQTAFLPLQGELRGRYSYFDSYLSARDLFNPIDSEFKIMMDYARISLKNDNLFGGAFWWIYKLQSWNENIPTIERWAEYTYQLQLALNEVNDNCTFIDGNYKSISIQCPVNVYIEDESNNIVAKIEGDEVINSDTKNLFVGKFGEEKLVCIKDVLDYKLRIVATDNGEMSYICKDIKAHKEISRTNYYNLPLLVNSEYISNNIRNNEYEKLNIIKPGDVLEELPPDDIIINQEQRFLVNVEVSGKGFIVGDGTYTMGDYVQFEAYPYENGKFLGWYENDKLISVEKDYRFQVMTNRNFIAKFIQSSSLETTYYTINALAEEHGTINPSGIITVSSNESKRFIVIPDEDYVIDCILIDDNNVGAVAAYEFTNIEENHTITAKFKPKQENNNNVSPSIEDVSSQSSTDSEDKTYATVYPYLSHLGQFICSGTWKKNSKGWLFLLSDGSNYARNQWAYIDNQWYLFDKNAYMIVGWANVDGRWYYLNPVSDGTQGRMLTGWQLINGKWYYFNEISDGTKGAMMADAWVGDYYVDLSGAWDKNKKK